MGYIDEGEEGADGTVDSVQQRKAVDELNKGTTGGDDKIDGSATDSRVSFNASMPVTLCVGSDQPGISVATTVPWKFSVGGAPNVSRRRKSSFLVTVGRTDVRRTCL